MIELTSCIKDISRSSERYFCQELFRVKLYRQRQILLSNVNKIKLKKYINNLLNMLRAIYAKYIKFVFSGYNQFQSEKYSETPFHT